MRKLLLTLFCVAVIVGLAIPMSGVALAVEPPEVEWELQGPIVNNDPPVPGSLDWNCFWNLDTGVRARMDKDVGSTNAVITDPHTMTVTIDNAYFCYYDRVSFWVHGLGTVPLKIWKANFLVNEVMITTIYEGDAYIQLDLSGDGEADLEVWWDDGFGGQLDFCDSADISFDFLVLQPVPQGQSLSFTIEIVGIQWNEYTPGPIGVASPAWTDTITTQATINTCAIDWELTDLTFTWECEPRSETAWAIADDSFEYEYQGGGWGQYFTYTIGDPPLTVPLIADQTILVGEVRVSTQTDGEDYLIVEYDTSASGWEMTQTHVYVGADPPPNMAPASFPYQHAPIDPPQMTDSYQILILPEWSASGNVYIAAHAVVTDGFGDCGVQTWTTVNHSVVVSLIGVPAGASGQLCFSVLNIGTIPIHISNIVIDSPAGVTVQLLPPDPTGTQLHPGESVPVCISINVTASGSYTLTITADAVQWNLYPTGPDTIPPVITQVQATGITTTSATITWTTDEPATSVVNYGDTTPPTLTASDATLVTSHSVSLSGLAPSTPHYYEVQSTDGAGNTRTDNNSGVYYSLTTEPPPQVPPVSNLMWPLDGTLENRTISPGFGGYWAWSECPAGVVKKHVAIDIVATAGENVYCAEAGTVKQIRTDSKHPEWKSGVVVDHSDFTTVYWHVEELVSVNDPVAKGQRIGTVADLDSNTHLHFGVRRAIYSAFLSGVGALPQEDCGGYPAFPEDFVDPEQVSYDSYMTPKGDNVVLTTPDVIVEFAHVAVEGTTQATTSGTNPVGPIPSGWRVVGPFVDVTSTATYSGLVTVGIPYNEANVNDESKLALFHWGSSWHNVTTDRDSVNNIIYGQVSNLSPFFVGEPEGPGPTPTPGDGEGGCFIATAAYGSYLDGHVETLRNFRDSYMVTNPVGSALVSTYYKLSPPVAEFIDDHPALKPIVRVGLLPAVAMSTVAISTTLMEKVAIAGAVFLVSVLAVAWFRKRPSLG